MLKDRYGHPSSVTLKSFNHDEAKREFCGSKNVFFDVSNMT